MSIDTMLHPGGRCVFLRAEGKWGPPQLVAFVAASRGRLEVWQTPDERRTPPRRTGVFPGPLAPLRIAGLLASGDAAAHLDPRHLQEVVIEGVADAWEPILLAAWAHALQHEAPGLHALLSLEQVELDECLSRVGVSERDPAELSKLGEELETASREWLERWAGAIDAAVRERLARPPAGGGSLDAARVRRFVEACVARLGRLPRAGEGPERWVGKGLTLSELTPARRARLGLDVHREIGRFRVRARFYSAVDVRGWDFDRGAGWYFEVLNPDPGWRFNDPEGPYCSAEEALEDAGALRDQDP